MNKEKEEIRKRQVADEGLVSTQAVGGVDEGIVENSSSSSVTDLFLLRFVVITATLVASAIAIGVIFAAMLMPFLSEKTAPEEITNWGGIIIGFYFGTFASLLKDWIMGNQTGGQ